MAIGKENTITKAPRLSVRFWNSDKGILSASARSRANYIKSDRIPWSTQR